MLLEQFLQCVPEELAIWIKEKKPESLKQAAQFADDYMTARNQKVIAPGTPQSETNRQSITYPKASSYKKWTSERTRTNTSGDRQCFHCRQWSHLMFNCPNRKPLKQSGAEKSNLYAGTCTEIAWNLESDKFVRSGTLQGRPVRMLVDTGCTLTMVRSDFVEADRVNAQEKVSVRCVHGDSVGYPTAKVELQIGNWKKEMRVAVAPDLPVAVLLGKDTFGDGTMETEIGLLAETRAMKRCREL